MEFLMWCLEFSLIKSCMFLTTHTIGGWKGDYQLCPMSNYFQLQIQLWTGFMLIIVESFGLISNIKQLHVIYLISLLISLFDHLIKYCFYVTALHLCNICREILCQKDLFVTITIHFRPFTVDRSAVPEYPRSITQWWLGCDP